MFKKSTQIALYGILKRLFPITVPLINSQVSIIEEQPLNITQRFGILTKFFPAYSLVLVFTREWVRKCMLRPFPNDLTSIQYSRTRTRELQILKLNVYH